MDDHDLHFQIDYLNEKHGWIHCYLNFNGLIHSLVASGTLPPFRDLLDFIRSITLQRLPAWFFWDEEGCGPLFEAWPLVGDRPDGNCPNFHLRVIHETNDLHWIGEDENAQALVTSYQVLWVDADLNREAVVDVFLAALRDFVLYSKDPESWNINLHDIQAFEHLRARNIPLRSDINQAGPIDLILSRWQDDEEQRGSQQLEMRMWDMTLVNWSLDDTDAFWPQWFALLKHALAGRPYEMSFIDMSILRYHRDSLAEGTLGPGEVGPEWSTRILAIPLDHPRHFRLQIFQTDYRYTDFLRVDEVIDVFQLAQVFLKEFEDLLNEGYRPYPDEDGNLFDFRELSLGRLKEKII